ncbi:hypothetical protein [Achromobacter arsenitoxydans]|uniref:Uncharacterized protein n=1 Tax=Achromobacter arsenitoxydans SY8 TaxID=477184 RepID=H0F4U7_9BURK|nr:hypothetical protein [Achromobacter arsenitoxydans]EHK66748.1 hypothetical protein KYC_08945 [Achromobacter arsenitoxydans SY8]
MSTHTIDPIGAAGIDDVRDPYRAERLRAQIRAGHAARVQVSQFQRMQAARKPVAAATPSGPKTSISTKGSHLESATALRDDYTAHCLKAAIQAFHDQQARLDARAIEINQAMKAEQTMLQARAEAANDLGTIQGLLRLQPYRYSVGIPPILAQQLTAMASAAQAAVHPVAQTAKPRSSTEDAADAFHRRPRKASA